MAINSLWKYSKINTKYLKHEWENFKLVNSVSLGAYFLTKNTNFLPTKLDEYEGKKEATNIIVWSWQTLDLFRRVNKFKFS